MCAVARTFFVACIDAPTPFVVGCVLLDAAFLLKRGILGALPCVGDGAFSRSVGGLLAVCGAVFLMPLTCCLCHGLVHGFERVEPLGFGLGCVEGVGRGRDGVHVSARG